MVFPHPDVIASAICEAISAVQRQRDRHDVFNILQ
jgi:hypothetical protein